MLPSEQQAGRLIHSNVHSLIYILVCVCMSIDVAVVTLGIVLLLPPIGAVKHELSSEERMAAIGGEQ